MENVFESMQRSAQRLAERQAGFYEASELYNTAKNELDNRRSQLKEARDARITELREQQKQQLAELKSQLRQQEEQELEAYRSQVDAAGLEYNSALDTWSSQMDAEIATKIFTYAHLEAFELERPSSHRRVSVRETPEPEYEEEAA